MKITAELISRYMEQAQQTSGWDVIIYDHYRILAQDERLRPLLASRNWHLNPYCLHIKNNPGLQRYCARLKNSFHAALSADNAVTRVTCYCGVTEYIIPILVGAKPVCALAVTGFSGKLTPQMRTLVSRRTHLSPAALDALRDESLRALSDADCVQAETFLMVLAALLRGYLLEHPRLLNPGPTAPDSVQQRYVYDALDYIQRNHARDIGIRDIAAYCHVSPSYLQHLFSSCRGCGVSTELRLCRLASAAELLCTTDHSVRAIALRCGFHAVDYFSTIFGRQYGMTPLVYRRRFGRRGSANPE